MIFPCGKGLSCPWRTEVFGSALKSRIAYKRLPKGYMVSIETCRKILDNGGYGLEISNDEINDLRDFLYRMAQYQVDFESVEENNNEVRLIA